MRDHSVITEKINETTLRIARKISELPLEFQTELEKLAESMIHKSHNAKKRKYVGQSWAGGLKEYRDQYSPLELQKKALEWWGD